MISAPALGAVYSLASALIWTLLGLVARALSPYLNALAINMLRSAIGGAFLAILALALGGFGALRAVSPVSWVYLTASIITAIAVGDTVFFESTKTLGLARAMTVSMVYPPIASLLAVWVFDERITPAIAAGGMVTLGGLALLVGERAPGASGGPRGGRRGLALALLAAVAWAVSTVLIKAPLHEVEPVTVQAVRLPLAGALLWLTPWARGTGRVVRAHPRTLVPLLILLGVLTAASSVTFVLGLQLAGVTLASILSATAPLFALPIGLVAFGERVTWRAVAGAAICIAGIAILSL